MLQLLLTRETGAPRRIRPRVHRHMRYRDSLSTIVARHTADLKDNQRLAKLGDADAVHDMRVAVAHLRAAFRFFAPWIDDRPRKALDRQLRWLAKTLGRAREVDIALHRGRPKGSDNAWQKLRRTRYRQLSKSLSSKQYERLLADLTSTAERDWTPIDHQDARLRDRTAWKRFKRWTRKLAARGKRLDHLSDRKLHRLRLRAKRIRYAAEWCSALVKPQRAKRCKVIQNSARSIQRTLGHLADASAHRHLAKQAGLPALSRLAKLRKGKSRDKTLETASRALSRLRRTI